MKKEDSPAFVGAIISRFEHTPLLEGFCKREHDALVLAFKAGVIETIVALVHIDELKWEDNQSQEPESR